MRVSLAQSDQRPRRACLLLPGQAIEYAPYAAGIRQASNTCEGSGIFGNTVIVVEHDETIWAADYVVDVGPGAGVHGGEIVAKGTPQSVAANPNSLTGHYTRRTDGDDARPSAARRQGQGAEIVGARSNNLKNVTVEAPLRLFTCVTGVSGGGKSTLVIDTLYKAAARHLDGASDPPAPHHRRIEGLEAIDKVIDIDRRSAARHARTPPPTRAPSPLSATGSPASRRPRRAAICRGASRSTSRAGDARPAG